MAWVFGDTIICDDAKSAQAVTFNKSIGLRTVTVQGDVYDPSGTLSGGSAPSGNGVLIKVQELNAVREKLDEAKSVLREVDAVLADKNGKIGQWKNFQRELEIKEHELTLLEQQVGGSNASRVRRHRLLYTQTCRPVSHSDSRIIFRLVLRSRRSRNPKPNFWLP